MNFGRISFITSFIFSFLILNATSSRFVLSGGQCIGKTTMLEYFRQQGFQVCPESFMSLRKKYEQVGELDKFFHALSSDIVKFQTWILDEQIELEKKLDPNKATFFDRGTVDVIAFLRHYANTSPQEIVDRALSRTYDLIFLLDPLPDELYAQTGFRREDPKDARAIHQQLKNAYTEQGYTVIEVPFDTVENRAQFILKKIEEHKRHAITKN